jgi:uncharacterized membrane protein YfcA
MTTVLLITFAIITFSSFVKGTVGFGNGMTAMPILMLVIPPQDAVVIILMLSLLMDSFNVYHYFKYTKFKKIMTLIIASIVGLPIGTYLLINTDTTILKLTVGVLVSGFAILRMVGWTFPIKREILGQSIVGFLCGLFGAAVSITGPPVALFYQNQSLNKKEFRGSMASYFLVLYLLSMVTFYISGVLTTDRIMQSIYLVPAMIIGLTVGSIFSHYVSEELFKKIALAIIFISGLTAIASVIWG